MGRRKTKRKRHVGKRETTPNRTDGKVTLLAAGHWKEDIKNKNLPADEQSAPRTETRKAAGVSEQAGLGQGLKRGYYGYFDAANPPEGYIYQEGARFKCMHCKAQGYLDAFPHSVSCPYKNLSMVKDSPPRHSATYICNAHPPKPVAPPNIIIKQGSVRKIALVCILAVLGGTAVYFLLDALRITLAQH